ncbi:MAG TPA: 30S ribosomal protein S3, partial [Tenericutes bacterium]|nr:30S ribosomal protein S3 [Mycoplasmatota bacterium]
MGQKVNPIGLRVGIIRDWSSRWILDKKDYSKALLEDIKIRELIEKKYYDAAIASVEIVRTKKFVEVLIYTAKPGMVIGRQGEEIELLRKEIEKMTGTQVNVSIIEVKNPNLVAKLVAENIAKQIENRVSFRVAQKRAIRNVMKAGAKGVKTQVSGRLGGADMARTEGYSEGNVPLHTLRADIDYALAEAQATYGKIGVKVWIYEGDVLPEAKKA